MKYNLQFSHHTLAYVWLAYCNIDCVVIWIFIDIYMYLGYRYIFITCDQFLIFWTIIYMVLSINLCFSICAIIPDLVTFILNFDPLFTITNWRLISYIFCHQAALLSSEVSCHIGTFITICFCISAVAVALELAKKPEFRVYQEQVIANARAMCKTLQSRGYTIVSGMKYNLIFLCCCTSWGLLV